MNACVRAVVRTAISKSLQVKGILNGFAGMVQNDFVNLNLRSVANIIQRGGTFIRSGRCPEFLKPEGRLKAAENLRQAQIDGLICIGGDGSFRGAHALWEEHQIKTVGIPATIDNDINGTDFTIGFDTAVNTALQSIDKIRDTAASHDRIFIVEVMGRNSGYIALDVGLAGGAEHVFIPESHKTVEDAIKGINKGIEKGKMSSILIAAEGQKAGRAYDLADAIRKKTGHEARVCILGHVQRGGSPTAADRILASRLGAAAVTALSQGQSDQLVGMIQGQIRLTPLLDAYTRSKPVQQELLHLIDVLAQ